MFDIASLDYLQLSELKERIAARMIEMRETGVAELRLKFAADAAALGLAPGDVLTNPKKQRRKRRPKHEDASPS